LRSPYNAYTAAAALIAKEFLGPRYYRLKTVQGLLDRGALDSTMRWVS
jgi:hypothetical protein